MPHKKSREQDSSRGMEWIEAKYLSLEGVREHCLCTCTEQRRTKLDDRSTKYIFIGYDSRAKAYKLFDPLSKKIHVSRDVEFKEEDSWNWGIHVEDVQEDQEKVIHDFSPPPSPPSHVGSPASSSLEDGPRTKKTRSLQELYEVTNDLTLFCLFADCESIEFEDAYQDKKWRAAMDEEIQ